MRAEEVKLYRMEIDIEKKNTEFQLKKRVCINMYLLYSNGKGVCVYQVFITLWGSVGFEGRFGRLKKKK